MAEYNPNFYIQSGIKMHPVGVLKKQEITIQKTQKSKPVVTYMERQRLEKEELTYKTKARLYGAVEVAAKFKILSLEDIKNHAPNIARRLESSGLREGQRSLEQIQQMFEKIPPAERSGISFEDALKNIDSYLSNKHFSHGKAHVNGGSGNADNIYLENSKDNLIRGGKDMTAAEIRNLNFKYQVDNVVGAAKGGLKAAPKGAAMAVFYVAVPTILDNIFAVRNGKISGDQAAENIGEVIGEAAVYGAVGAFAIYFAAALIPGVAPALIAVAPVAKVAGNVFFVKRLFKIISKNIFIEDQCKS